jgi:tRNA threonylcarbamoyl adenosine modification protein YeaZ
MPSSLTDTGRPLLLALDTGSPRVSVAVGRGGEALAVRSVELSRSSERLLSLVAEALAEAGAGVRDLGGIVALRGPGSFTGLRVGLATALGLHQALGLPSAALPTLRVLAAAAPAWTGPVVGAVDALRGEWFVQAFEAGPAPAPRGPARRVGASQLPALGPALVVGFGVESALARQGPPTPGLVAREPGALAPVALRLAAVDPPGWDAAELSRPLYLRPPAVTVPGGRASP